MTEQPKRDKVRLGTRHGGNKPVITQSGRNRAQRRHQPERKKEETRTPFKDEALTFERFTLPWFLPHLFTMERGVVKAKPNLKQVVLDLLTVPNIAEEMAHITTFKCSPLSTAARQALVDIVYAKFSKARTPEEEKDLTDFNNLVNDYIEKTVKEAETSNDRAV